MKKLIIFLLVVAISSAIFFYFDKGKAVKNSSHLVEINPPDVVDESSSTEIEPSVNSFEQELVDFKTQPSAYLNRCGLSKNNYYDVGAEITQNLSEHQLVALEYFKAEDFCKEWYIYLSDLSEEKLESLRDINNEVKVLLDEFNTLTIVEKNDYSKGVLKGEVLGLKERFAIMHLLQNDFDLIEKIAEEIGTKNLGNISRSARTIGVLYDCELDSAKCSKMSPMMLSNCLQNEEYCKLDYLAYLEKNHSLNEINDFYNILGALKKILSI